MPKVSKKIQRYMEAAEKALGDVEQKADVVAGMAKMPEGHTAGTLEPMPQAGMPPMETAAVDSPMADVGALEV